MCDKIHGLPTTVETELLASELLDEPFEDNNFQDDYVSVDSVNNSASNSPKARNTNIELDNSLRDDDLLIDVNTVLEEYLKINSIGKEILKKYNNNNNCLKKTTRSKLVRLVIRREKDWKLKDIPPEQQLGKFD